jgi:hypothetical protein
MSTQCKSCIWSDNCPDEKDDCDDYSPIDGGVDDLMFYAFDLLDRKRDYDKVIEEYRDPFNI